MKRALSVTFLCFVFLGIVQSSRGFTQFRDPSAQDPYCLKLEKARLTLTLDEEDAIERQSISPSAINEFGQSLFLLHERLGGSCADRFFLGVLLSQIIEGEDYSGIGEFVAGRADYVENLLEGLWRSGSIEKTDLAPQRELLLTFKGFPNSLKSTLLRAAFKQEGLSHPVFYALWVYDGTLSDDMIENMEHIMTSSFNSHKKIISLMILKRHGLESRGLIDHDRLFSSAMMNSQKTAKLRSIFERLELGESVSFQEVDALGLIPDD